jgi:Zn finger protein HypA/HybF involved in hydrogenase expression
MSWYTMSALTCPACAQAFEVPTADTVNVTRLPAHRGHELEGNFHRFACPSCGHASRVERDFLYTDLDRAQMVQVHRPDTDAPRVRSIRS